MKVTLTCTTPHGTFQRKTHRKYSHVVVYAGQNSAKALSWCGSARLASDQLRYWQKHLTAQALEVGELGMFPVDGAQ